MEVMGQVMRTVVRSAIGVVVLASITAGCSGSKVTTKSSNEIARYKIRSIALLPFTSIATPQVSDQDDLFVSTPQSLRRADISMAMPRDIQPPPKQAMVVPGYAAEKVTELFWGRLQDRKGVQVLSPGDAVRVSSGEG